MGCCPFRFLQRIISLRQLPLDIVHCGAQYSFIGQSVRDPVCRINATISFAMSARLRLLPTLGCRLLGRGSGRPMGWLFPTAFARAVPHSSPWPIFQVPFCELHQRISCFQLASGIMGLAQGTSTVCELPWSEFRKRHDFRPTKRGAFGELAAGRRDLRSP